MGVCVLPAVDCFVEGKEVLVFGVGIFFEVASYRPSIQAYTPPANVEIALPVVGFYLTLVTTAIPIDAVPIITLKFIRDNSPFTTNLSAVIPNKKIPLSILARRTNSIK